MRILNILVRRLVDLDRFEATVTFYEDLIGQKARLRFDYPEHDLKLAQVASILFIGGSKGSLVPFADTTMTLLVEDLDAYARHLPTVGAEVLKPPKQVPTGRNMLVRHPDGTPVEYVEHHDKKPADRLPW